MSFTTDVATRYISCTPHRPGVRYHVNYDDFDDISFDLYNSSALRAFEVATNQRIRWLRKNHNIPVTHLPSQDDLWITMPYRAMEALTLKRVGHSVCQRILSEEPIEDAPPSLLTLGFIKRRFVARRVGDGRARPATTIYKDSDGEFILVDEVGDYVDVDGEQHSAMMAGFSLIERQYLYCIEAVNEAIVALDSQEPPRPLPRWEPTIEQRGPTCRQKEDVKAAQETTKSTGARLDAGVNGFNTSQRSTSHGNTPENRVISPSELDDNMTLSDVSRGLPDNSTKILDFVKPLHSESHQLMHRDTVDLAALRVAPWAPETIIGLTSFILAVPARPDGSDEEQQDQWIADWCEPAQWLGNATVAMDPRYAWEKVQRQICGMTDPSSQIWYSTGRGTNAPVTLRHVVGWIKTGERAGALDGHNWHNIGKQLEEHGWHPVPLVAYDGPPLEILEEVTAIIELSDGPPQANEPQQSMDNEVYDDATKGGEEPRVEELTGREPTTDKVEVAPAMRRRRPGMTYEQAQGLADRMRNEEPTLIIDGLKEIDGSPGFWGVVVAVNDREVIIITRPKQWYAPPGTIPAIDEAILYGDAVRRRNGSGRSSPLPREQEDYYGATGATSPLSEKDTAKPGAHRADYLPGGIQATYGEGP